MTGRSAIQVTLWNSAYLGNFMWSELLLARAVRDRLGLTTHFVLDHGAEDQPWLADLDAAGHSWSILPADGGAWREHLAGCVREHDGALVHANFTAADLQSAAVAHRAGVPCIWHIRTGFNGYPMRQRAKDLVKMRVVARRRVAHIIAVSPWLGQFAQRRGAPAERVSVVPDPTVFERFAELPDRSAARERFGLDRDALVVLGLGWWPEVKGVDILLDAVSAISGRYCSMQTLLVGEERMRSFLAERDDQPDWLRLSGFVEDPAWLFAAADVFVSASRHEGQSSAIGEALACGLPVVMSDIPGTTPWGKAPHVLRFPSEDRQALAAILDELLASSAQTRAQAGSKNRSWSKLNSGVEAWSAQLCSIYKHALDRNGAALTSSLTRDAAREDATNGDNVLDRQLTHGK